MHFVLDLEVESSAHQDISNHPDFNVVLEEINVFPENLHHKLLKTSYGNHDSSSGYR
jgi:hypothetical protein